MLPFFLSPFKKVDLLFLEAMATRSETTEEAVGPMPAPGPEKTVVPISSPSIAIIFVLPFTCAIGLLFLINLGETSCLSIFLEYSAVASSFILYPIKSAS